MHEKSCGAVLFTWLEGEPHYALVQQKNGDYGFPKGHMEPGETETETALREIWEETHLKPVLLDGFRMVSEYFLPDNRRTQKQVVFFLAEFKGQEPEYQQEELRGGLLVGFAAGLKLLTHQRSREILQAANDRLIGCHAKSGSGEMRQTDALPACH